MTKVEAIKLMEIAEQVDGGCPVCAHYTTERIIEAFPDVNWRNDVLPDLSGDPYTMLARVLDGEKAPN